MDSSPSPSPDEKDGFPMDPSPSPSTTDEKPTVGYGKFSESTLFEDKWCKVKRGELVIKWFYFPTAQSRKIDANSIKALYYVEQDFHSQCGQVKGWGMSLSPIWWACDIRRNWHPAGATYYNVVVDCGQSTMKAFTVIDIADFMRAIRPQLLPDTIVRNEMP